MSVSTQEESHTALKGTRGRSTLARPALRWLRSCVLAKVPSFFPVGDETAGLNNAKLLRHKYILVLAWKVTRKILCLGNPAAETYWGSLRFLVWESAAGVFLWAVKKIFNRSALNNLATDALKLVVASWLRPLPAKTHQSQIKTSNQKYQQLPPFSPVTNPYPFCILLC